MPDLDHLEAFYRDKLWRSLPEIYRALDSKEVDAQGPLFELVARIGSQAAVVRRSLDRLWDDQSIETSDDWVIPYLADLLSTNLVAGLDARGQRLDVAKTIYYRRRKGTVAMLEELAADVTGWDARVVEAFRRLGRTRHGFDPAIGRPADAVDPAGALALQLAQGLVGPVSGTPLGGFADLRDAYAATLSRSAFDESFHAADLRRGVGAVGWYDIPRLLVFQWRLTSFGVEQATPVEDSACPGQYTFDPSGRDVPLFAMDAREGASGPDRVGPSAEWQAPTPIGRLMLTDQLRRLQQPLAPGDMDKLYPASLAVFRQQGGFFDLVDDVSLLRLFPTIGRFIVDSTIQAGPFRVDYHVGFPSTIGAGPYDRRVAGRPGAKPPSPELSAIGGGTAFGTALAALGATGTTTIGDSLTYTSAVPVAGIVDVTIRAANRRRPLIRLAGAPSPADWVLTGSPGSRLALEGLWVAGADVILRGRFDQVRIVCCTLDPGDAGPTNGTFGVAADGRALSPTHLFVEGSVRELLVDRSLVGPVRVRAGGSIERLAVVNSIVQAVWAESAIRQPVGEADLSRCTVMGTARLHRVNVSESVLDDEVQVDDTQHGCVRFSAWSTGSVLPRKYESVEIRPQSPLFTSRIFGRPGYGQLLDSVDQAIVAGGTDATIAEGAEDGSEMGAYARERVPIKRRSLAIKFDEYMPLGLTPVFIPVT